MEDTERKSSAKVWPKDFIRTVKTPDEKERTEEIDLKDNVDTKIPLEDIPADGNDSIMKENAFHERSETIIKAYPTRIEAKVINIK